MCTQYYNRRLKNFTNIARLRDYYQATQLGLFELHQPLALPTPTFAVRRILLGQKNLAQGVVAMTKTSGYSSMTFSHKNCEICKLIQRREQIVVLIVLVRRRHGCLRSRSGKCALAIIERPQMLSPYT